MGKIITRSGILSWTKENIDKITNGPGIYILRSSPMNGGIINIESAINLKEIILKRFTEEELIDVKFFDWYETNNFEDAKNISNEWKIKYDL